ncbi:hypothetical protein MMC25_004446 [Agyrium rufum]|nr:hypothetical protein [Agyrium rufum]
MAASRVSAPAKLVQYTTTKPFICRRCLHRASASSTRSKQFSTSVIRPDYEPKSKGSLPLTERLRRRVWGTDKPPGQADPYSCNQRNEEVDPEIAALKKLEQTRAADLATLRQTESSEYAPKQENAVDKEYVPATTWDGLQSIGGQAWKDEQFDRQNTFRGFLSMDKVHDQADLEKAIRRALVEIFAFQEAGRPLSDISYRSISTFEDSEFDAASFTNGVDNGSTLQLKDRGRQVILGYMSRSPTAKESEDSTEAMAEAAAADNLTSSEVQEPFAEEGLASPLNDETWKAVQLTSLPLRFAVVKRVMQLTGRRIPDPIITKIATAEDILEHLVTKPKPKKLAEALAVHEALTQLPNVQIKDRRFTPIDREKEVGRWKVIERELEKRGLPVTGTRLPMQ